MIAQLLRILSDPDVLSVLAWSFIVAAFIGALLDREGRDLFSWLLSVTAFAILDAFGAVAVMNTSLAQIVSGVAAFTLLIAIDYSLGLTTGWLIVIIARQRASHEIEKRSAINAGISITQVRRNRAAVQEFINRVLNQSRKDDRR